MERLTNEKLGNSYGLRNKKANVVGAFKDYDTFYEYLIAINRLGEYEDTGLSPDGVVELKEKIHKAIELIDKAVYDMSVDCAFCKKEEECIKYPALGTLCAKRMRKNFEWIHQNEIERLKNEKIY